MHLKKKSSEIRQGDKKARRKAELHRLRTSQSTQPFTWQRITISLYYSSSVWIIDVARVSLLLTRRAETDTAGERESIFILAIKDSAPGTGARRLQKGKHVLSQAVLWLRSCLRETKAESGQSKGDLNNKHSVMSHSVPMNKLFRNNLKKKNTLISH